MSDLGGLVRKKRRHLGVTQQRLAALSNVGPRFVSELERGKATCEIGKVLLVLERLGIEVWLFPRGRAP